jgi:hypothetical protein
VSFTGDRHFDSVERRDGLASKQHASSGRRQADASWGLFADRSSTTPCSNISPRGSAGDVFLVRFTSRRR